MALVADPGLALFRGINSTPKKSYLSEYSSRLDHTRTTSLLEAWHRAVAKDKLFSVASFNLDLHSTFAPSSSLSDLADRNNLNIWNHTLKRSAKADARRSPASA